MAKILFNAKYFLKRRLQGKKERNCFQSSCLIPCNSSETLNECMNHMSVVTLTDLLVPGSINLLKLQPARG